MSTQITADMIKELREKTGVGMAKCKEALTSSNGDMEQAIELLRKQGIASAVKKESRDAKEGVIGVGETSKVLALVEVSAETDFVTSNVVFQEFLKKVADQVAQTYPQTLEELLAQKYVNDQSVTIDEMRALTIQTVGENVQVRRFVCFDKKPDSSLGVYSHMNGKILSVVELSGSTDEAPFAREIAMHVAAAHPDYLNPASVPESVIAKEKEIAGTQVVGKPANIIEKIVDGKIKAFYDAACLTCQKFIKDDSVTVAELVDKRGKEKGKPLSLTRFARWSVGN